MTSKTIALGILKAVGVLTFISLLLYFIYQIQIVLVYLIIALILSLIANPIVEFLRKRLKFSNVLAVSTTLFLFILFIAGLVMLLYR